MPSSSPTLKALLLHRRYALLVLVLLAISLLYLRLPSAPFALSPPTPLHRPSFSPGLPHAPDQPYTQTLVVASTKSEDTSWFSAALPNLTTLIYTADDPSAPLHPPSNKGHEAAIYLTYLIDHYHTLPDISIFVHAHQFTWHNNDALSSDMATMLRHLSPAHVTRQGYFNLRCHWKPGCPNDLWSYAEGEAQNSEERDAFTKAWGELQPESPLPRNLSQPCCAQFALSRERVLDVPLARLVHFRDWLERTDLADNISGRIFEHTWQFIFTGQSVYCPKMHVCYCDGYGVCFGGEAEFEKWAALKEEKKELEGEIGKLEGGEEVEAEKRKMTDRVVELDGRIREEQDRAFENGRDPEKRAKEVGRKWRKGDGF